MLRVPHWALTALLALSISVLPLGASWAEPGRGDGRDTPPAHGREKEDEDRKKDRDQDTDEQASAEGDEQKSEGGEDQRSTSEPNDRRRPSPRSSASPEPSDPTRSNRGQAADVVDVAFAASPASIAVGETSTLEVSLTNPSDTPAGGVEVLIDLPAHLELVSSRPPTTGGSDVVRLVLEDVPPGATRSASVVVIGVESAKGRDPVRFAVTTDGETFHHELFVEVDQATAGGLGLSQSSPLLLQVGDSAPFSATVRNGNATPLHDVVVVTEIAPELDVVGVSPIAAADAVQLGSSPHGEDIVWLFDSLEPGEEVELLWTARAAAPGDLEAGNTLEATVQGQPAGASRQDTYLGYVQGVRTERPAAPAPVVRERVVTKLVPVASKVAGAAGGILPATGWSPGFLGFGGALLIGLGSILVWASRGIRDRRSALVLVGALLLTATACVSDQGSTDTDQDPQAVASPSPEQTEPAEEQDDQVLGLRVKRPDRQEPDGTPPVPPTGTTAPEEPVTEVVYEEVSEVVSVVVPVTTLPMASLADRVGDNNLSFTWDGGADLQAASSRMLTRDATEEILVSLTSQGHRLLATVTVANLADDRRLRVEGRLDLQIVAGDGRTSTLTSDPIDVVLEPGASTAADLAFSLPSGSYSAKGAFLAN